MNQNTEFQVERGLEILPKKILIFKFYISQEGETMKNEGKVGRRAEHRDQN